MTTSAKFPSCGHQIPPPLSAAPSLVSALACSLQKFRMSSGCIAILPNNAFGVFDKISLIASPCIAQCCCELALHAGVLAGRCRHVYHQLDCCPARHYWRSQLIFLCWPSRNIEGLAACLCSQLLSISHTLQFPVVLSGVCNASFDQPFYVCI